MCSSLNWINLACGQPPLPFCLKGEAAEHRLHHPHETEFQVFHTIQWYYCYNICPRNQYSPHHRGKKIRKI